MVADLILPWELLAGDRSSSEGDIGGCCGGKSCECCAGWLGEPATFALFAEPGLTIFEPRFCAAVLMSILTPGDVVTRGLGIVP